MTRRPVRDVGTAGIIRDIKPQLLPFNVWSGGRNVRFEQQRVFGMGGVVPDPLEVSGEVSSLGLVVGPAAKFIVYSTNGGEIFAYDGATATSIASGLTEGVDDLFDIFSYNGLMLARNDASIPLVWVPELPVASAITLPNWNTLWRTKKIVPFGPYLVALFMIEGVDVFPHKMRWSHPAEPGSVPISWDETDPTRDAGEFSFADTDKGVLVNAAMLGSRLYIYKEGSIWAMSLVGGNSIFARESVTADVGLFFRDSLLTIPFLQGRPHHFFAGDNAFYVNDGLTVTSIFENVFRNEILNLIDPDFAKRSFSVLNHRASEVWFCIPEKGSETCTLAFCFDYKNNTSSIRELSGTRKIVSGIGFSLENLGVAQQDISFSDNTFFSDGTGFFEVRLSSPQNVVIEASKTHNKLFYLDVGQQGYNNEPYPRFVERVAVTTATTQGGREAVGIVNYHQRNILTRLAPKIDKGSAVVQIGAQETENAPVVWSDPLVVDPEDYKVDPAEPVSGRFLSVRFSNNEEAELSISGFDYEVVILGEF